MNLIRDFSIHGESGLVVNKKYFLTWVRAHRPEELGGRVIAYSWFVGNDYFKVSIDLQKREWTELPDSSGFICIEAGWQPNNCLLLDAFGVERMRLTVPWDLTKSYKASSKVAPTSFVRIGSGVVNPKTGIEGEFGLIAWVEHSGSYYFELDYHSGRFLWGREIRD